MPAPRNQIKGMSKSDDVSRVKLMLERDRSIATIIEIRDNKENGPEIRLRAAQDLLDRSLGKARQQTNVDVTVNNPALAHVNALQSLATMARGANLPHNAHNNPLKSLGNFNSRDELSINHAPIIDVEAVPIEPSADSLTDDSASASSAETPPAPPPGRGRK